MVKRHSENTYISNYLLLHCENVCLLQWCKYTDGGGKKRIQNSVLISYVNVDKR